MRRVMISALAGTVLLLATGVTNGMAEASVVAQAGAAADPATTYGAVLADTVLRTAEDRERDAGRHTAGTLAFAEVQPGDKIADMIIGGGYFTRVFSVAAGPAGHVTAWQPAEFLGFSADYLAAADAADQIANVDVIRSPIGTPEFPAGLDLIFTAQNYHDLHLASFATDTAAKVNAAAFAALNPGGLYVVVDHHAAAGSGLTAANTLHRIDIAAVKAEVEAAGFVLDGESTVLVQDADPLTANVFDPAIRGKTSQFMLRFKKPG